MRIFGFRSLPLLLLAAAPLAGCESSAGGFTHTTAAGEVSSQLTVRLGDGEPRSDRLPRGARVQECRNGAISLSVAPGARGTRESPRLSTLYVKLADLAPGRYPVAWQDGAWTSAVAIDGTITPDPSRSIAPFGMDPSGRVRGELVVDRVERGDGDARIVAGSLLATVEGDPSHRLAIDSRFEVTWQPTDGCP